MSTVRTSISNATADGGEHPSPAMPTHQPQDSQPGASTRPNYAEVAQTVGSTAVFALIFAVFAFWLGSRFFDAPSRVLDFHQATPVMFLVLGLVPCIAAGQFDLSIAATASLATFLTIGLNVKSGLPIGFCIACALGVGILIGLSNGFLVAKLKVNAFIATLAVGGVVAGAQSVYSGGGAILPDAGRQLPSWFAGRDGWANFQLKAPTLVAYALIVLALGCFAVSVWSRVPPGRRLERLTAVGIIGFSAVTLALAAWSGIPNQVTWPIVAVVLAAAILWVGLSHTSFGRSIYAVGGNPRAAHFTGIRVDRVGFEVFVISGLFAGVSGVVAAGMQGSAVPGTADANLLPAYAGVFLSTVLLSRGRAHVWGALAGGLFLIYISAGLVTGGVQFTWSGVINGAVLLAIVAVSSKSRLRNRLTRRTRTDRETATG